jgi:hypothetical protein
VKKSSWQRPATGPEAGLSHFLVMYVLGLVGVLLAIHMLLPETGTRTIAPQAGAGLGAASGLPR